jgi:uncharacterized protein
LIPVGFTLQPEEKFLELLGKLIGRADYYEIAPETLWAEDKRGALRPNGFHRRFAQLKAITGKPFVAHGVGLSMGTASAADRPRTRQWLSAVGADHEVFEFLWYTDHLGATSVDGLSLTLPLPLPMTRPFASSVRRRLRQMQRVVPRVGVENNVAYFLLGSALEEPLFLRQILSARGMHLLLDLHNLHTMAVNFGFDPAEYVARLPLDRVIELHLSGGSFSDPRWLPSGKVLRLDSHDGAVPEEVWRLYEAVAPQCPRLRGVTLERMEGTVEQRHVAQLGEELARARGFARRLGR